MNPEQPSSDYLAALDWRFGGSCMGGWCAVRDTCALYRPGDPETPVERLCAPGGHDARVYRRAVPAATAPRYTGRPASVFEWRPNAKLT